MWYSRYNFIFKVKDIDKEKIILFNPLSGAIDLINQKTLGALKKIRNGNENNIPNSLLLTLFNRGYVFNEKNDEEKRISEMYEEYKKLSIMRSERYVICPTYSCNLRCIYCFQNEEIRKNEIISKKVLKKIFDTIEVFHKEKRSKKPLISLFGGEPLIKSRKMKDNLSYIINECKNKNYNLSIATNGVDILYFIDELENEAVANVQISLDGPKEVHDKRRVFPNGKDSFDIIINGIENALRRDIPITLRINVDKGNIMSLPKLADFIVDKGWDSTNLFCYIAPIKKTPVCDYSICLPEYKILHDIFEMYKRYPQTELFALAGWQGVDTVTNFINCGVLLPPQFKNCEANVDTLIFDLYGDLYACLETPGYKEFSIGKFYPKLSINIDRLAMWRNRTIFSIPKCRNCKYNILCGGGCAILAYYEKRDVMAPYCKPINKALKLVFEYNINKLEAMINA